MSYYATNQDAEAAQVAEFLRLSNRRDRRPAGDVYVGTLLGRQLRGLPLQRWRRDDLHAPPTTTPLTALCSGSPFFPTRLGTADPNSEFYSYPDNFALVPIRDIVADPSHPGRVYVATSTGIYDPPVTGTDNIVDVGDIIFARSDDYGLTWQHLFWSVRIRCTLMQLQPDATRQYAPNPER